MVYLLTTAQRRLEVVIEREGSGGLTLSRIGFLLALPTEGGVSMSALACALCEGFSADEIAVVGRTLAGSGAAAPSAPPLR